MKEEQILVLLNSATLPPAIKEALVRYLEVTDKMLEALQK